jgi:hypothetical protein
MGANRKFITVAIACLFSLSTNSFQATADPADAFPSGPYDVSLISASILYPSLFGVNKGLPVADVSGVLLPNGTIRAFVFAQNKGIEIADSTDGKIFTRVGNAFGGDRGQGMPRVVKLSDGRFRMYNSTSEGVSCSISSDGLNFTSEKTTCISKTSFAAAKSGLTGPGIVKLSDGRYRAFFSDMVIAGTGPDPHQVFSATSTDGLTWTADSGVRIGTGAANVTRSAEHPAAAMHADGSITLFFYDNASRGGKDAMGMPILENGAQGLWYATSTDGGLTFANEHQMEFPSSLGHGFGNDPDVFLDKDGNMILWAGGFDTAVGGYIGALKLTKQVVAATPTPIAVKPLPSPTPTPMPVQQTPIAVRPTPTPTPVVTATAAKKITITCVKGKLIKKVTAIKPTCPAGYKKK